MRHVKPVARITRAALQAKEAIDRIQGPESLEKAYLALGRLSIVALKTPFCVQDQAEQLNPSIPVLEGLLHEIHTATVRLCLEAEKSRIGLAS